MKSIFFLAAIAAPLFALAEPGDSALAEVVRRQPGPKLLARSGVDASSIPQACQSQCSSIVNTLDACNNGANCECTQAKFNSLGTCMDCLQALSSPDAGLDANLYMAVFENLCLGFGYMLNNVEVTASPTGTVSTFDPFAVFEPPTATPGATQTVSADDYPLLPTGTQTTSSAIVTQKTSSATVTQTTSSGKTGGAVGLDALQNLNTVVVGAVAVVVMFMGALPL
ncbi:hypothetical protein EI94DRAFT_1702933 [Lactarius quietus]|nr:hypothetical protein EI94DRAFT_1702933 [Lactarius quietus]